MRGWCLAGLVVAALTPAVALADIGQPQSFSVTISRANGVINADLAVVTQGVASRAASDALNLQIALFVGGSFPPSFIAPPQSAIAQRGVPTSNRTFSASFSIAVPDEHQPFKYLALARPSSAPTSVTFTGTPPSAVYEVISFLYSSIPEVDVVERPVPTPTPGGPPIWYWEKGAFQLGTPVPTLTLWGLVGLGVLLAAAGALLMRRS